MSFWKKLGMGVGILGGGIAGALTGGAGWAATAAALKGAAAGGALGGMAGGMAEGSPGQKPQPMKTNLGRYVNKDVGTQDAILASGQKSVMQDGSYPSDKAKEIYDYLDTARQKLKERMV